MDTKRCYEILGLSLGASQDQVKKAYYELAKQWHPDKVAHNPKLQAIAQEEMKNINAAHDALKSYQPTSRPAPSVKNPQPEQNEWRRAEEARQREAAGVTVGGLRLDRGMADAEVIMQARVCRE